MKRAEITIKTTQTAAGQTEQTTFVSTCRYKYENDVLEIFYVTEENGAKTQTHLSLYANSATMESKGMLTRSMQFVPGEVTETSLALPMGRLDFLVKTKDYQARFDESEILAQVSTVYDLWNQGALAATNALEILVRELD